METLAYGVDGPQDQFHPMKITRRNVGDCDVALEILFCGICHSDIHSARSEWHKGKYPMVPGHEILGKVVKVGSKVAKFKNGDLAGVGCIVDSCRKCPPCKNHEEHLCKEGAAFTYDSYEMDKKTFTYGGYSKFIVVDEHYVNKVSNKFTNLAGVAPLFCAGITTFSPLRAYQHKVGPGKKVGIVGLGGLGHMGVKFASSMGAEVTVFSTSPKKEADAKKLGATSFVVSTDNSAMKGVEGTFDFILDTVSAKHEIIPYMEALTSHGVLALVGAPPEPLLITAFSLIFGSKTLCGSLIGGMKETQEMIDYCADHNIVADVEVINVERIAEAYERTLKSDVKYRFVLDIAASKQ